MTDPPARAKPLPVTPEELARILVTTPPKRGRDWRYLRHRKEVTQPPERK